MGALPFCQFEMTTKKPISKAYPKALLTLGDHIRKKRLDLKLLQTDVANILNVDEMTISGWELNHYQPHPMHIPRIINFLGYIPEDLFSATTIGQKIRRYRLLRGVTRKKLARELHIDESTLLRLEADKGRHLSETLRKLAGFLESLT